MKCLQCGTELDRLSKWRGSSEYCSEECKKANQDEFNRLAMSRLMQPRPARSSARAAAGGARGVERSAGSVTAVTHPAGATAPIVTEPPEAAFIIEVFAALSAAQSGPQTPLEPRPGAPLIPEPDLPMADSLLALEAMLRGTRPSRRGERSLPPLPGQILALASAEKLGLSLPEPPLAWPASLATEFSVVGLDSVPFASSTTPSITGNRTESSLRSAPAGPSASVSASVSAPVAHRSIPARRPLRDLPELLGCAAGTDYLIQSPAPSAPRLRIHLPKPVLQPYRPRYAFAPREAAAGDPVTTPVAVESAPAAPPAETPAESQKAAKPAPVVDARIAPKPAPRSELKQQAKAARKIEAKSESPRAEIRKPVKAESQAPAIAEPTPANTTPANTTPANTTPAKPEPVQPEKKLELVPKPESRKEEVPVAPVPPITFAAPSFGGKADAEPDSDGFFSRMAGWQKAAAAVLLLGVAIAAWAVPAYNRSAQPVKTPAIAPAGATMAPTVGKLTLAETPPESLAAG